MCSRGQGKGRGSQARLFEENDRRTGILSGSRATTPQRSATVSLRAGGQRLGGLGAVAGGLGGGDGICVRVDLACDPAYVMRGGGAI
jgi:hypothetical protein